MSVPALNRNSASNAEHGSRRSIVVESLLRDVFQGRLRAGRHLVTQALAERFGVSHTPIREALITLAGIGVVELLPNRGAVVKSVTPDDIGEICQVRKALECEAVRGACGRIDLDELKTLQERLVALRDAPSVRWGELLDEARDVDGRLHDLIARSSGNNFLANELGRLKFLFRAFRDIAWEHEEFRNDFTRLAGEAREHLDIVEGLLARDRGRASRAMARHIQAGRRYWSRALPDATPPHPPSGRSSASTPSSDEENS